jgi:hypothetical protein
MDRRLPAGRLTAAAAQVEFADAFTVCCGLPVGRRQDDVGVIGIGPHAVDRRVDVAPSGARSIAVGERTLVLTGEIVCAIPRSAAARVGHVASSSRYRLVGGRPRPGSGTRD